jgi:nicotinate-nucleotide adenylyltransferase
LALRRLDLDEVWWLVSPQNPLKPVAGMAPFAQRLAEARRVAAAHPPIVVSDLENGLNSRFTADTVKALRRRFRRLRFVWLMGGDNLLQLRRWERWPEIFGTLPIAVFDRPGYSRRALAELPARRFAGRRLPDRAARRLSDRPPPAWVFFHTPLDAASATQIRTAHAPSPPAAGLRLVSGRPPAPVDAARMLVDLVCATLEQGLADDVVTLDLAGKTTIADFMVVANGRSARQVLALTERLEAALAPRLRLSIEGKAEASWVLIDAGDVIVHLFRPETRAYYNLEKMWTETLPDGEAVRQ